MKASRVRGWIAIISVVALVFGACGNDDDDPTLGDDGPDPTEEPAEDGEALDVPSLDVTAVDDGQGGGYGFEVAASMEAGAKQLNLTSTGAEPHHAQLFKLNDDATMDDLGQRLATGDPTAALEVGVFQGGTGLINPGGESQADAVVNFTEGTWVLMCFIENAEGPHLAQGMLQPFEVTAADAPAELPTADAEAGLVDFGFELPGEISGDDVLEVSNRSEAQPHEITVVELAEGATQDDVLAFFAEEGEAAAGTPPPFSALGGMQALLPGSSQELALDLDPGEYVFFCGIPDFTSPEMTPHYALGMITTVTVS